jgi:hypothetical protein
VLCCLTIGPYIHLPLPRIYPGFSSSTSTRFQRSRLLRSFSFIWRVYITQVLVILFYHMLMLFFPLAISTKTSFCFYFSCCTLRFIGNIGSNISLDRRLIMYQNKRLRTLKLGDLCKVEHWLPLSIPNST